MDPKVHDLIHNSPQLVPNPSNINPIQALTSYFFKIRFNIILQSTPGSFKWSLSLMLPHQILVYISLLSYTCYRHRPSLFPQSDKPNNIWPDTIT